MNGLEFVEQFVERPIMADAKRELALILRQSYNMGVNGVKEAAFDAEMFVEDLEK